MDFIAWVAQNFVSAIGNILFFLTHPSAWADWSDPVVMVKFIYYGGSVELFFAVALVFILTTLAGLFRRSILWSITRAIEWFNNGIGRFFAWAGLLMVLQQVMIVFLQRIFRVSEISIGPFGYVFTKDLSWFSEELKFYNALIVVFCCAYTFIQGGHVRVDLFYGGMKYRTKKLFDAIGTLVFIFPSMTIIWMYAWFFMWRHLVTPKISASDKLELLERKARLLKWNVETIGFTPSGFDAYFLFKVILVAFAGLMLLQGVAFFYRSLLEFLEGPEAEGKYHDKDQLGDEVAETSAQIH